MQTNFYAIFECGKQVQKAEQLTSDYNKDIQKHGNENIFIIERIADAYNLAATNANRASWDKEIEFKNEAARWQEKYNELTKDDNKPYDLDALSTTDLD